MRQAPLRSEAPMAPMMRMSLASLRLALLRLASLRLALLRLAFSMMGFLHRSIVVDSTPRFDLL